MPKSFLNFQQEILRGNHLQNLAYKGVENVRGDKTYRYSFDLNKDLFTAFFQDETNPLVQKELENVQKFLKDMKANGELWISADEKLVVKNSVNLKASDIVDDQGNTGSMTFDIVSETYDTGKRVSFDVPKEAKLFDLSPFLGEAAPELPAPVKP